MVSTCTHVACVTHGHNAIVMGHTRTNINMYANKHTHTACARTPTQPRTHANGLSRSDTDLQGAR